jgi:antitoxin YefM
VDGSVRAFLLNCTATPYDMRASLMDSTTVNKFRENLKSFVEQVVTRHMPLRVTRRNGSDFVVMSAEDWERDQETLYVLQNTSLMRQIAESSTTHSARTGYAPTKDELNEIIGV